jgi:hypothetical protein
MNEVKLKLEEERFSGEKEVLATLCAAKREHL